MGTWDAVIAIGLTGLLQAGTGAQAVRSPGQSASGKPDGSVLPTSVEARPATAAADAAAAARAEGVSQVRIVRLSQAQGRVELDRGVGRGFEPAVPNIPIVAGAALRTTADALAEVEFEDNSSLRLTPNTTVVFDQLSRTSAGATLNTLTVQKGAVYVSLAKSKSDEYTVQYAGAKILLDSGSHMRLQATELPAKVAVLDGTVRVQNGTSETMLHKKQALALLPTGAEGTLIAKAESQPYDDWDKTQQGYHKRANAFAGSNGLYGSNDLSYYGHFVNLPGCGSMWQPYFVNAGWDPFGSGVWAYYPRAGYSWVSPYPWGWLPFHSGSWQMCGAGGWGWRPGGSWQGLQNTELQRMPGKPPMRPILPPRGGQASLIPVNLQKLQRSGMADGETFQFRQNSAGFGVPRQAFGGLHDASRTVEHHGMAATGVSLPTLTERQHDHGTIGFAQGAHSMPVPMSQMRMNNGFGARETGGGMAGGAAPGMQHGNPGGGTLNGGMSRGSNPGGAAPSFGGGGHMGGADGGGHMGGGGGAPAAAPAAGGSGGGAAHH